MAILDQIDRSGHWIHRRTGFYVHSVQSLCAPLQKVEGLQQNHSSAGKKTYFVHLYQQLLTSLGGSNFGFPASNRFFPGQ